MALSFAHPELLAFALLGLVPLAIHLFNRQRARPKPFAAIDFLLRSKRRTARALRLRKFLLFCARTLLLLAIPLALARPHFVESTAAAKPTGPRATAIAFDTSLSMRAIEDGTSRFERARALAIDALHTLPYADPVTLVDCAANAEAPLPLSFDRGALVQQLQSLAATFETQDLTSCLQRAARALAESALPAKRILFATDLTQAGLNLDVPAPSVQLPDGSSVQPDIVLLDAALNTDEPLANAAISSLDIEPIASIGPRAYRFAIAVQNHSGKAIADLPVRLRIDGEVVAKGFLDVPAHQSALQILTHRFTQSGPTSGVVEIDSDALQADDSFYFTLDVPRQVRALLVNGSPNPVRFLDEAFFVQAALDAQGSVVRATVRQADALDLAEEIASFDVVILLNVRDVSEALAISLQAFVEAGGGMFIALGDQVDADAFNDRLAPLLPRLLRLVKTAAHTPARLAHIDLAHPALELFAGEEAQSLLAANFSRYFLLESAPKAASRTLASFDDGAPALIEHQVGKGRVLLFTSTLDRAWTDLPIRTGFLPLMQRLMGLLSRTLEVTHSAPSRVGEPRMFSAGLTSGQAAIVLSEIQTPTQAIVSFDAAPVLEDDATPRFEATTTPGIYAVSGMTDGKPTRLPRFDFAVNVDSLESDLRRIDVAEFKTWFGQTHVTRRTTDGSLDADSEGWPLWSLLLCGALLCFVAECLLLKRH